MEDGWSLYRSFFFFFFPLLLFLAFGKKWSKRRESDDEVQALLTAFEGGEIQSAGE